MSDRVFVLRTVMPECLRDEGTRGACEAVLDAGLVFRTAEAAIAHLQTSMDEDREEAVREDGEGPEAVDVHDSMGKPTTDAEGLRTWCLDLSEEQDFVAWISEVVVRG